MVLLKLCVSPPMQKTKSTVEEQTQELQVSHNKLTLTNNKVMLLTNNKLCVYTSMYNMCDQICEKGALYVYLISKFEEA